MRIINEGTPDALLEVYRLTFNEFRRYDVIDLVEILASFTRAARQRDVIPTSGDGAFSPWNIDEIRRLLDHPDNAVRHEAIRLLGAWKIGRQRGMLEDLASTGSKGEQAAAIDALAYFGGQQSIDFLASLAANGDSGAVRSAAVGGLTLLDLPLAAEHAAVVLTSDSRLDPTAILTPFLELNGGAEALGAALADVEIPADVAKLAMRHLNAVGRQETELVGPLVRWADIAIPTEDPSPEAIKEIMQQVVSQGNAERGEAVFRRSELSCLNCHAISGGGSRLGPDLMSVGTSSPLDYIVEAILAPNKTIKEDYEAVTIVTTDGRFHSGIIQRENENEVILRDALADEVVIPAELIEETGKTASLMPVGLTVALTRGELVDLVRFLSELGKPGPFAPSSVPVARRWRVLASLPEELAGSSAEDLAAIVARDEMLAWIPAYSTVAGLLPIGDLVPLGSDSMAYARTQVNVSNGGFITLKMNSIEGLDFWIDGDRVPADEELLLEWGPGVHTVTIRVDLAARDAVGLRAEFGPAAGSGALLQLVGGR